MNLYKEFNCNTKEELYYKIKNNDKDVKSLIDFINYAKLSIKQNMNITSVEDFASIVSKIDKLQKNNISLIFADTKNNITKIINNLNIDNIYFKDIIQDIAKTPTTSVFIIYDDNIQENKIKEFKENLSMFNIKIIDSAKYNNKTESIMSNMSNLSYDLSDYNENYNFSQKTHYNNYSTYEKYDEFITYYAKKEIHNLDIKQDYEHIKTLLKLNFQHKTREIFGYLPYDENNKIYEINELFKGGKNASIVDNLELYKSILSNEKLKGFIIFHNHPSGNIAESKDDIDTTKRIIKTSILTEIPIYDHLIIGKENVKSFREEVKGMFFTDTKLNDFQKFKIDEIKSIKENEYHIDFLSNKPLCKDKEFIKFAIENLNHTKINKILLNIDEQLKNDREIILSALKRDGTLISQYPQLNNDEEVVLTAMKSNKISIIYASNELKKKFEEISDNQIDEYLKANVSSKVSNNSSIYINMNNICDLSKNYDLNLER